MWFKHRAWISVAWILSLINLAAVWFAAQPAETWHATTHALLAVLFALGAQRLAVRRRALMGGGAAESLTGIPTIREELTALRQAQSEILTRVEQTADAMAVELERVGEGQRFLTKVLAPRRDAERGAREGA